MSTRYKRSADVPNDVLAASLKELAHIIATGNLGSEFTMRVPAELDRDADLVLAEAANRIMLLDATCFNPEPKPCQFKKGDRVLVRDYDNIPWRRRYFAGENPNQHQEKFGTFAEGFDEWSANGRVRYWKYCKPWTEGSEE